MVQSCIVIVGAGQAGARAALALRSRGWSGRIVLAGEEVHLPYERPPLSKQALVTPDTRHTLVAERARYDELAIELRLHTRATDLDLSNRRISLVTAGGGQETLSYDKLLLATGGRARRLEIPGAADDRVLTLRHAQDAARLSSRLLPGRRIVVIGGGFIGLEVAASARLRHCEVVVLEAGPLLLGRAVPASLSARVQELHVSRGVEVRFNTSPIALELGAGGIAVCFGSGDALMADTVVVGIGMTPEVALAREAGLRVRRGIAVDRTLKASDDNVFAAGDACEFPLRGETVVMESWANAEAQAELVACNMTGESKPFEPECWMWSDQFDHTLQMTGQCGHGAAVATRAMPGGQLEFHLDAEQRIVGAAGFAPSAALARDFLIARRLVRSQAKRSPQRLGDSRLSLKSLLAG